MIFKNFFINVYIIMNSDIRNYKIMYLATTIGLISFKIGESFGLDKVLKNNNRLLNAITSGTYNIYSFFISQYGGSASTKFDPEDIHYFLKLNELIYDNFEDKEKIIKKTNIGKVVIDEFNENTIKIILGKGDFKKYYSLIFLAIPFALKINDKDKLINTLLKFLSDITNDSEHIFATITCSLFINYALNGVEIEKWIENISEDLNKMKDSEKYIDYINNYYELNFRNNMFILQKIEFMVHERNKSFINNYCNKNNKILSQNPMEQVLLIYDTLLRCKSNWESLIFFGMVNFNDNISISIIIGILYELLFSSGKVNKYLLKRFSF